MPGKGKERADRSQERYQDPFRNVQFHDSTDEDQSDNERTSGESEDNRASSSLPAGSHNVSPQASGSQPTPTLPTLLSSTRRRSAEPDSNFLDLQDIEGRTTTSPAGGVLPAIPELDGSAALEPGVDVMDWAPSAPEQPTDQGAASSSRRLSGSTLVGSENAIYTSSEEGSSDGNPQVPNDSAGALSEEEHPIPNGHPRGPQRPHAASMLSGQSIATMSTATADVAAAAVTPSHAAPNEPTIPITVNGRSMRVPASTITVRGDSPPNDSSRGASPPPDSSRESNSPLEMPTRPRERSPDPPQLNLSTDQMMEYLRRHSDASQEANLRRSLEYLEEHRLDVAYPPRYTGGGGDLQLSDFAPQAEDAASPSEPMSPRGTRYPEIPTTPNTASSQPTLEITPPSQQVHAQRLSPPRSDSPLPQAAGPIPTAQIGRHFSATEQRLMADPSATEASREPPELSTVPSVPLAQLDGVAPPPIYRREPAGTEVEQIPEAVGDDPEAEDYAEGEIAELEGEVAAETVGDGYFGDSNRLRLHTIPYDSTVAGEPPIIGRTLADRPPRPADAAEAEDPDAEDVASSPLANGTGRKRKKYGLLGSSPDPNRRSIPKRIGKYVSVRIRNLSGSSVDRSPKGEDVGNRTSSSRSFSDLFGKRSSPSADRPVEAEDAGSSPLAIRPKSRPKLFGSLGSSPGSNGKSKLGRYKDDFLRKFSSSSADRTPEADRAPEADSAPEADRVPEVEHAHEAEDVGSSPLADRTRPRRDSLTLPANRRARRLARNPFRRRPQARNERVSFQDNSIRNQMIDGLRSPRLPTWFPGQRRQEDVKTPTQPKPILKNREPGPVYEHDQRPDMNRANDILNYDFFGPRSTELYRTRSAPGSNVRDRGQPTPDSTNIDNDTGPSTAARGNTPINREQHMAALRDTSASQSRDQTKKRRRDTTPTDWSPSSLKHRSPSASPVDNRTGSSTAGAVNTPQFVQDEHVAGILRNAGVSTEITPKPSKKRRRGTESSNISDASRTGREPSPRPAENGTRPSTEDGGVTSGHGDVHVGELLDLSAHGSKTRFEEARQAGKPSGSSTAGATPPAGSTRRRSSRFLQLLRLRKKSEESQSGTSMQQGSIGSATSTSAGEGQVGSSEERLLVNTRQPALQPGTAMQQSPNTPVGPEPSNLQRRRDTTEGGNVQEGERNRSPKRKEPASEGERSGSPPKTQKS